MPKRWQSAIACVLPSRPGNRFVVSNRRSEMRALRALAIFAALYLCGEVARAADVGKIVWPKPVEVHQGELVEVKVTGDALAAVEGQIGNEKMCFYPSGPGMLTTIFGADVEAKPGSSK